MTSVAIRLLCVIMIGLPTCQSLRKHRTNVSSTPGGMSGVIAGIITVGAPAGSAPAMPYLASDSGCFPGLRIVSARELAFGFQSVDIVPPLTRPLGYSHPMMRSAKIFIGSEKVEFAECGEEFSSAREVPSGTLHNEESVYFPETPKYDLGALANLAARVALPYSTSSNPQEVADALRGQGWHLVQSSDDGNSMTHLIQNPENQECFLTFRGSKSFTDWVGNLAIRKVDFCGLPEKVHNGFRNNLRLVVSSDEFQQKIRSHLPKCSKVYGVGHSLGGITAQLFAACAAQSLAEGDAGFEDHSLIGWTTETPGVLNYPWG